MSDKSEAADAAPKKKKGKLPKLLMLGGGVLLLVGGGVGAGVYAAGSGLVGGGGHEAAEEEKGPKLVPKSEQKHAGSGGAEGGHGGGGGEGGGHGEAESAGKEVHGIPMPEHGSGEPYASNYYAMEKDFTSNLRESVHFIQVGIAVSTPYDDTVVENLKTNDIAIRSAILMTLSDATEEQVFSAQGKEALARRLVDTINGILRQKEGFGGISNVYFTSFVVQ